MSLELKKVGAAMVGVLLVLGLTFSGEFYKWTFYQTTSATITAVSRDGCKLDYRTSYGTQITRLMTCADARARLTDDRYNYHLNEQVSLTYQYVSPVDGRMYLDAKTQIVPVWRLSKVPTVGAVVTVWAHRSLPGRSLMTI